MNGEEIIDFVRPARGRAIVSHENPNGGASNDWLTPSWILAALGPFDLDPCVDEAALDAGAIARILAYVGERNGVSLMLAVPNDAAL